jgi:hypothetical protein
MATEQEMTLETVKAVIAAFAAIGGLTAAGLALFNYRNAVRWKRAELASGHLKELTTNEELVFACRALDWNGGLLVVPESLRPLLRGVDPADVIEHSPSDLARAMELDLSLQEMQKDPRLQVYRTAIDSLLSWLSLARKALDRDLYEPADIEPIAWWLLRIQEAPYLRDFMHAFGYQRDIEALQHKFSAQMKAMAAK